MSRFSFHSYLLNFTPLFCLPIHFHFIFISFSFPFDYWVWAWTQLASHFLQYLLVDQLYVKKVYFCSFVTKSNQAFTKYSPVVFNSFYRTVTHGGLYHRIFTSLPLKHHFPTVHIEPLPSVASPFFFSLQPSKPPPKNIKDFNRSWQASSHCSKQNFLFENFHFSVLAGTLPSTCSFN